MTVGKVIGIGVVILFNYVFWMIVYYAQRTSRELDVTDYTNKHFYEPVVNLGALMSLMCLLWIIDIL